MAERDKIMWREGISVPTYEMLSRTLTVTFENSRTVTVDLGPAVMPVEWWWQEPPRLPPLFPK